MYVYIYIYISTYVYIYIYINNAWEDQLSESAESGGGERNDAAAMQGRGSRGKSLPFAGAGMNQS